MVGLTGISWWSLTDYPRRRSSLPFSPWTWRPWSWILLAGIKSVCQSIDLIECHYFRGIEPHDINAEAVQLPFRGFRIGQVHPTVSMEWLVHEDSMVEEAVLKRNEAKNKFANDARAVQLKEIIEHVTVQLEDERGEELR
jgi:hypothetical protein